ncbi:c-di-AMP phosphodiesterase-like protein [Sporomusaceae bacterium BoRhaA]|uniref:DHH family phosphoesterase n=1 Tax=Pelorhabdus rhamnosifermentans TaxID=2772457 RepID=UPI001C0630A6|nr:DHH family phosphoesterase [Pelorhabdus rhamnosifermentans]MBU2700636.1 c-di-AMP phosphodiesterase-like protein [Pelorhabdus rhamnosifermentans]
MSQGPSSWFDTRIYLAVAAALLAIILFYNQYVAVLGAVLLYALYCYGRERHLERQHALAVYMESMTGHIDEACLYALQGLPVAIALIDEEGLIHWCNHVLTEWSNNQGRAGENIFDFWPDLPVDRLKDNAGSFIFAVDNKKYHVQYRITGEGDRPLRLFYLTDITETEILRTKVRDLMPVFAYIQIDNYVDVLKGLNETQKTAILAEVNQKLVEWMTELNGFLKKYSEELYIGVFNHHALEKLLQDRFDILDKVRDIHGGNKIPLTLSMGVAADESSIAALDQRAQAGLDLALGRGGDQASVHIAGKMQFYGGKTKAVEKNTRVKARIVAQAIRDTISDAELVLVMGHLAEDFDSLGAALGVAKMARILNKPVHIIMSPTSLAVNKLMDLVPEYKEYENLLITPEQASALIIPHTLAFVVDTHRPEMTAAPDVLTKVSKTIVIDHHRRSESFIRNSLLVYLEPSASSTSELVTELLMYFDDNVDLTRLEASGLYAGIIVDTKHFTVQTGVRTFEAASYLRRSGADPSIVRHLFRMDFESIRSRALIMNNTEMYPGGIVIAICPDNIKEAQVVAAQTADLLLSIEGVNASFVLISGDDGVGISARSEGDINVQLIMEALGGGGHQLVAGVKVKGFTVDEVKSKLLTIVDQYLEESESHEINSTTRSEKTW